MTLRALLIDFNAYFASVEQQVEPRLRGRPVAVVPMLADTTCCIAASYEARKFGVKTLTRVGEAKKLCPELVLVKARHDLYVEYHHRAVAAVDSVVPVEQVLSIDEMVCRLTPRWQPPEVARALALQVKHTIQSQVGECLRTSIGIAPNTFLAKQASNMVKPDGLTVIRLEDLPQALYRLPLAALTGIGPRMLERLHKHRITTVEQLYAANKDQLRTIWGGIGGEEFYARLRGENAMPAPSATSSISHSHVLAPDLRTAEGAYAVLNRLTQKAAMRLRKADFLAGAMSVRLKFLVPRESKNRKWHDEARFIGTQDTADFIRALDAMWARRPQRMPAPLQVGMVLHDLSLPSQQSGLLFESTDRHAKLNRTLDALNVRYGRSAVYFGGAHQARDHGRMAIAFNHIPDLDTER